MTYPTKTPLQRAAILLRAANRARISPDPRKTKHAINLAIQHSRAEGEYVPRKALRQVRKFCFLRLG